GPHRRTLGRGHDGRATFPAVHGEWAHGAGRFRRQHRSGAHRHSRRQRGSVTAVSAGKIVVADDDAALLQTLTWILKNKGYEVVAVPDGENLVSRLEEERPDLL